MTGRPVETPGGWLHVTTPEEALTQEGTEPRHETSLTGAAAEWLSTGSPTTWTDEGEMSDEQDTLRAGDPDSDADSIATSGDDAPGSSNGPPDDNDIDEVGALYGVAGADGGPDGLVLGDELIAARDRHRWENNPDSKDKTK